MPERFHFAICVTFLPRPMRKIRRSTGRPGGRSEQERVAAKYALQILPLQEIVEKPLVRRRKMMSAA